MEKVEIRYEGRLIARIQGDERNASLNGLNIVNIDRIENLDKLEHLDRLELKDNAIQDLSRINGAALPHLRTLDISGNQIQSIEGLGAALPSLTDLNLWRNPLKSLRGLGVLERLQGLDLGEIPLPDTSEIGLLKELTHLNLSMCSITSMACFEPLKKLEYVDLSYNNISVIQGIHGAKNLEDLILYDNHIIEIAGLERLVKLDRLDLGKNKISEIKNLETLVELTGLYLNENIIRKIQGLDALVKLRELDLSGNRIRQVEGLGNLVNLVTLKIAWNPLPRKFSKFIDDAEDAGYATEPQLFVKYCQGDKNVFTAKSEDDITPRGRKRKDIELIGNPEVFQFERDAIEGSIKSDEEQIVRFFNEKNMRMKLNKESLFLSCFYLAQIYHFINDLDSARKYARYIFEDMELIDYINGKIDLLRDIMHLRKISNPIEDQDQKQQQEWKIKQIQVRIASYVFCQLLVGDRAKAKEALDFFLKTFTYKEGFRYSHILILFLLNGDFEKLDVISKELGHVDPQNSMGTDPRSFIIRFIPFVQGGKWEKARKVLDDLRAQVEPSCALADVFLPVHWIYITYLLMKDVLDAGDNKDYKLIFH